MNKKQVKVYLGFEDEPILDESNQDVNYTTNKIGGEPKYPPLPGLVFTSQCNVCNLERPLLLQCYAPLSSSPYHRTLYVFACINPACWNNPNSWSCFRSQYLDEQYAQKLKVTETLNNAKDVSSSTEVTSDVWCSGADEWGDDEGVNKNAFAESTAGQNVAPIRELTDDRMSDSEDESIEVDELDTIVEKMSLGDVRKQEATAEIEEGGCDVIVDEMKIPEDNLINLLCQVPELPEDLKRGGTVQFDSKYISVEEEYLSDDGKSGHVQELLKQYQAENNDDLQKIQSKQKSKGKKSEEMEEYEKAAPRHGNEILHNFLTRVQMNPTQILRYAHGGQPLPMSPLPSSLKSSKCLYCNGEMSFELQILPTIIPSLRIRSSSSSYLDFGTAFVYTCKTSCWGANDVIKNEIVFVQREPV